MSIGQLAPRATDASLRETSWDGAWPKPDSIEESATPHVRSTTFGSGTLFEGFRADGVVACIGLATGPEALKQIVKYGVALPVAASAVSLVPSLFALFYGKFVLKMHPAILCGALCGRQASTPALNAVTLAANSNAPVLGYTVPYTIANVLLTLAGPVIVMIS